MTKKLTKLKDDTHSSCKWQEALQSFLFLKQAQGIGKTTLNDYKRHVEYFFNRYPTAWQSSTLRNSIMKYMSDEIMPATFNLRLIYLKAFFEWSVKEKHLEENPLKDFKKRKAQARIVDIAEDTLQKLIVLPNCSTFAGLRDYALLMFTLDTGIRPKEALSLKEEDFDFKRFLVTIPADVAKTRTSRTLPLLPPTAEAVHKLIKVRHPSWNSSLPVFCSCEGTPLNHSTWRHRLIKYSTKLGTKIRPYDLRHAFALLYLRSGGHAFGLQKTLGHADMTMTKKYVNLTGQDLQEVHRTASPLNRLVTTKKNQRVRSLV